MWLEVKVISDIVLTVGGITLGVIFVRKVCQISNYLGHMSGALCSIEDTLRPSGSTLEKYVTPEQRCPGLRKAAIEHGPEEDYPEDKDPQDDYDCTADRKEKIWKKAKGAKAKLEKKARDLLTGGEF